MSRCVKYLHGLTGDAQFLSVRERFEILDPGPVSIRGMRVHGSAGLGAQFVEGAYVVGVVVGDEDSGHGLRGGGQDLRDLGPGVNNDVAFWRVDNVGVHREAAEIQWHLFDLGHVASWGSMGVPSRATRCTSYTSG